MNSPPEQQGPVNCPLPTTVSMARVGVLSVVGRAELLNEGHLRPIIVRTKPGTIRCPRQRNRIPFRFCPVSPSIQHRQHNRFRSFRHRS